MKKLIILFGLLIFTISESYALCIGCGCQRAYRSCLSHEPGSDWCATNPCGERECKGMRDACHGTGIRIQLGIANPDEPTTVGGSIVVDWESFNDSKLSSKFNNVLEPVLPIISKVKSGERLTDDDYAVAENIQPLTINNSEVGFLFQKTNNYNFKYLLLAFVLGIVLCFFGFTKVIQRNK